MGNEVKPHHVRNQLCTTRPLYRQGRDLKAVKVYTVSQESRYLLVQGVPAVGAHQELLKLFSVHGSVDEYRVLDEYPAEDFTEVFWIKYHCVQSARVAKRKLDDYSFFGGSLHVCYAPEYESVDDTRLKLQERRKAVAVRIRKLENEGVLTPYQPSKQSHEKYTRLDQQDVNTAVITVSQHTDQNTTTASYSQPLLPQPTAPVPNLDIAGHVTPDHVTDHMTHIQYPMRPPPDESNGTYQQNQLLFNWRNQSQQLQCSQNNSQRALQSPVCHNHSQGWGNQGMHGSSQKSVGEKNSEVLPQRSTHRDFKRISPHQRTTNQKTAVQRVRQQQDMLYPSQHPDNHLGGSLPHSTNLDQNNKQNTGISQKPSSGGDTLQPEIKKGTLDDTKSLDIREYKTEQKIMPKFKPRQVTEGKSTKSIQFVKRTKITDAVNAELRKNASILTDICGPQLPENTQRKRKLFTNSDTGDESLDKTAVAIRQKVAKLTVIPPPPELKKRKGVTK